MKLKILWPVRRHGLFGIRFDSSWGGLEFRVKMLKMEELETN
jgi:hypothetical protein